MLRPIRSRMCKSVTASECPNMNRAVLVPCEQTVHCQLNSVESTVVCVKFSKLVMVRVRRFIQVN